jgi:predicted permease
MTWLRVFIHRLRGLFLKRKLEQDLEDEIRAHLELQIEENLRQGMSPDEARYQARRKFGGVEQVKESYRDRRSLSVVDSMLRNLRYALRMLRRSPGFTAVAVLTLALGIGANTAIFSMLEGVVLAPLPYRDAERLVTVWQSNSRAPRIFASVPDFQDWQRNARSFEQMVAIGGRARDLTNPGAPAHLDGREISAGFFSTLGVNLSLGREFSSEEDRRGGGPVVIISNRLWQDRFGGSPDALGRSLTMDGIDHTIVGVLPSGDEFRGSGEADVYTPFGQGNAKATTDRAILPGFLCVARLKPGVTIDQARSEMATIQNSLNQLYPSIKQGLGANVVPLKEIILGNAGQTLLLLMGAVGLVLLIACANIANLLLARAEARSAEFAIRMALGASRMHLASQLITESLLISVGGGVLGLAMAKWAVIPSLLTAVPASLPRSTNIGVNTLVLLFTFGLTIVVGILSGLAPLMKSSNPDLQSSLKEGGRGVSKGRHNVQRSLVITQMAVTLVLLTGAMLLFRTVRHLWAVDPGFNSQGLITFKVGISPAMKKTASSWRTAYQQLTERIQQIPGVQAADFTYLVPQTLQANTVPFWVGPGPREPTSTEGASYLQLHWAGPEYLKTMEIPLLRGRFLTPEDTLQSEPVIVIDSILAQTYFPDKDPVGQTITIRIWGPVRVVGVVGHVRLADDENRTRNQAYASAYQLWDDWVPVLYPGLTMVVRAKVDGAALLPAIKDVVYGVGDNQPVYDIRTMQEILSESITWQRFNMFLLGAFALLALILAAVGIYGVITYMTTERTHEIGVRMALGADRWTILRMVMGGGLRLALIGIAIGVAAALILGRILSNFSSFLYGVQPWDPLTLIAISLVLIGTTLLACYLPARRAAGIDPMIALRHQ